MGFPPGIIHPREDRRHRATPSSDNPFSGVIFVQYSTVLYLGYTVCKRCLCNHCRKSQIQIRVKVCDRVSYNLGLVSGFPKVLWYPLYSNWPVNGRKGDVKHNSKFHTTTTTSTHGSWDDLFSLESLKAFKNDMSWHLLSDLRTINIYRYRRLVTCVHYHICI